MADTTPNLADHFPRGVTDPFCAQDHVIETSVDRRLLWHLRSELLGYSGRLGQLGSALSRYLNGTCAHHWHSWAGDADIPAHRQCLWCCDVEWADSNPTELGGVER